MTRFALVLAAVLLLAGPALAQETETPTESPTPTETPTATNTASMSPTPSLTPTPSMTVTRTATNTRTSTITPTPTKTDTPTKTPIFTKTSVVHGTATQTPTRTITPTASVTPTGTQTNTPTCGPRKDVRGIANASFCQEVCPTATGTPGVFVPCVGAKVPASNDFGETKTMTCFGATTEVQVECFHSLNGAYDSDPIAVGTPVSCPGGFLTWEDDHQYCACAVLTPGPTPISCFVDRGPQLTNHSED